jgi:hypothetical protein
VIVKKALSVLDRGFATELTRLERFGCRNR